MTEKPPAEDNSADNPNDDKAQLPQVVEKVDPGKLQHFITTIKTAEQQVGENIIQALQCDGTMAVLTTVVLAPDGQQRVVSAALNPDMMKEVQEVLKCAAEEREEEEPCIGFHCFVKPKQQKQPSTDEA